MTVLFYSILLIIAILSSIHFYKKRSGWWLVLSICNIALNFSFILKCITE